MRCRISLTYTVYTVSSGFDQKSWGVPMINVLDDLTSLDSSQNLSSNKFIFGYTVVTVRAW